MKTKAGIVKTQIILFSSAENMLKRYGIKTDFLNVEKMQTEYDALMSRKVQLREAYQTAEKEAAEAENQLKNILQYFGITEGKQEKVRTTKKHEISL